MPKNEPFGVVDHDVAAGELFEWHTASISSAGEDLKAGDTFTFRDGKAFRWRHYEPPEPMSLDEAEVIARHAAKLNPWVATLLAEYDRIRGTAAQGPMCTCGHLLDDHSNLFLGFDVICYVGECPCVIEAAK